MSFSKSWNYTRRSGSCNFSFLKNSLVQINSKLNSKPYDYLYKLNNHEVPLRRSNARLSVQIKYRPSRVEHSGFTFARTMPCMLRGKVTRLPTSSVGFAGYKMTHLARLFVKQINDFMLRQNYIHKDSSTFHLPKCLQFTFLVGLLLHICLQVEDFP